MSYLELLHRIHLRLLMRDPSQTMLLCLVTWEECIRSGMTNQEADEVSQRVFDSVGRVCGLLKIPYQTIYGIGGYRAQRIPLRDGYYMGADHYLPRLQVISFLIKQEEACIVGNLK